MSKHSKQTVQTLPAKGPGPAQLAGALTTGRWPVVVSLALAMTVLNALKPMHMDDTAYYKIARQIAGHPLDPYGFHMLWYQHP